MIYKSHHIELFINGKSVEFENQGDVDIRFNNILFDPTKITSNQSEYSFEFELPCTPTNNKIFEFANNLSKLNKFHARYDGELYADGTLIFKGSVTLNSISNKHYNINLVQIKNYSLEEIFGEATMNEIPWTIDFDGAPTINQYNADPNSKVTFPLISYGVFQKAPYYEDKVAKDYTSVYDVDKYSIWYQDTFAPSLNMLELMKKAFEWKGYTVQGDAMNDYFLKDVFCSTNIAQDQVPIYNIGNPKFGAVSLRTQWRAKKDTPEKMYGNIQDIKFKQWQAWEDDIWNWDKIRLYDMLNSEEGAESITMLSGDTYMYQPNEKCIVIPADGFYEITMIANATLEQTSDYILGKQFVVGFGKNFWKDLELKPDFRMTSPIEIQLVKNYNEDVELIHGPYYTRIRRGNPAIIAEREYQYSLYPHEKIGILADAPFADTSFFTANGVNYVEKMDANYPNTTYINASQSDVLAYDPLLNPNFICGATSIGNENAAGSISVIKNGYSWCSLYGENHDSIYKSNGYMRIDKNDNGEEIWKHTDYQENTYPNSPRNYFSMLPNSLHAEIRCLVKLNKDDILKLFAVHRHFELHEETPASFLPQATYTTSADVRLTIRAVTEKNYAWVREHEIGYGDTDVSDKLNVTNWQNQETKVSDWIQHIADAFNLKIEQFDKTVTINLNKQNSVIGNPSAVDVDNRVNAEGEDVESETIDYPRSMAVKYKIDTDEHGFHDSVPAEHLEQDDWEDWGDYGYDVITLNDDSYVTSTNDKNLQFSYTWYDDFYYFGKDHERMDGTPYTTLNIPVISKEEYMIDHSKMQDKAMLRDGFSLAQRFWFRPSLATDGSSNPLSVTTVDTNEDIYLYTTKNYKDELNLSYKLSEKSLLKQYFDISAHLSSNFVTIEVYLTPQEYNRIKNGAYVRFDSDLYKVCSVEGYDPSGTEPTELKLMKKVTA